MAIKAPIQLDQLHQIALSAGKIMKKYFMHYGMERVVKADKTPLTQADSEINALVIEQVRNISSDIDIVGEEESNRTESPWQIVVDPVDGTFPYTWGMPLATFMIGLLYQCKPIMGVIYDPFTDRMYLAEKGAGAKLKEIQISGSGVFGETLALKVSSARGREDRPILGYVSWPGCRYNILKACEILEREHGITCVNMCTIGYIEAAVATGEFAATLFPGGNHHDTAPGHIIVTEAGGKVTDVFGKPLEYGHYPIEGHIMSNGTQIHELIIEAIKAVTS